MPHAFRSATQLPVWPTHDVSGGDAHMQVLVQRLNQAQDLEKMAKEEEEEEGKEEQKEAY